MSASNRQEDEVLKEGGVSTAFAAMVVGSVVAVLYWPLYGHWVITVLEHIVSVARAR